MNKKVKKTLAVGLTALTLSGIGGATLFAATGNESHDPTSAQEQKCVPNFNDAVTQGIIDEATATKMVEYLESNKDNDHQGTDMFASMVSAGIITEDQATQLKANGPQGEHKDMVAPNFNDAVTQGIIDEATATKMVEYLESNKDNGQKGTDMFASMVSSGIITEDQGTQLKAMGPQGEHKSMGAPNFNDAVTKGIIDEATATKMVEYLESNKDNTNKSTDMFADLVKAGVITEDQSTQLKANGPQSMEKN